MEMNIQAATTVGELVTAWLKQLRVGGHLENTTINEYERVLRKLVLPEIGNVRLNELTTERINDVLTELGTRSVNRQRKAKVVMGAMLNAAMECGVLPSNPARGSISVSRPQTQTRTLAASDLESVRTAVRAWVSRKRSGPKANGDMADIIDLMLGTSARIGEVLALRWSDVDLDAKRVEISATIKTETGMGTYRKPLVNPRTIELSDFAATTIRRRQSSSRYGHVDAVFPTRNGTWQQVNNVERRWRQIRKDAGLAWVTPEFFRHHVAREV